MGRCFEEIDDKVREFITAQPLFFVATAPLAVSGHVNLSPKGLDTLRILGPKAVAYLDHVGSGAETIAHLRENGRIALMFCSFEGSPKIFRLYGTGRAIESHDTDFAGLSKLFSKLAGARTIVHVTVDRIAESCGFGVPCYTYQGQRPLLEDWVERKGGAGLLAYQRDKNATSIDGLPTLRWLERESSSSTTAAMNGAGIVEEPEDADEL